MWPRPERPAPRCAGPYGRAAAGAWRPAAGAGGQHRGRGRSRQNGLPWQYPAGGRQPGTGSHRIRPLPSARADSLRARPPWAKGKPPQITKPAELRRDRGDHAAEPVGGESATVAAQWLPRHLSPPPPEQRPNDQAAPRLPRGPWLSASPRFARPGTWRTTAAAARCAAASLARPGSRGRIGHYSAAADSGRVQPRAAHSGTAPIAWTHLNYAVMPRIFRGHRRRRRNHKPQALPSR